MTIWWSKATRLLEFSRSVNRTLRSRAGWDFSVTQQQQDKRILGVRIPWLLLSILQGQGNDIRWNLQPACLKEHDCFGKVQNPKLYFFTSSRTMICHSLKWRRGEGCAAHSWVNSSTFCDNTVTVGFLWPGQFFHILAFWWYTAIAHCKILEVPLPLPLPFDYYLF